MNQKPLVSVVLPFRNAEKTLSLAISSVLDQSWKDLELLLINNASTDGSFLIAQQFASADDRVKLLTAIEVGVAHAANVGLENASGEFIARMDADDESLENRLQKQVKFLQSNPSIDLVSCQVEYAGSPTNLGLMEYVKWVNSIFKHQDIHLNRFVELPIVNPSIMMRRILFEKYGGYQTGELPEDYEFFLRLQEGGVKMEKVDETLFRWHDSEDRLTRNSNNYSVENFFRVKSGYLYRWLERHNPHHPRVTVWGAGKQAKKFSGFLALLGVQIEHYIDVDEKRSDSIHYLNFDYEQKFILSYVGKRGVRDEIRDFLFSRKLTEGQDFLICA